jgi:hypothetical protein
MAERMRVEALPPAMRLPEAAETYLAMLEIAEEDMRRVEAYRQVGGRSMTLVSWTLLLHIFTIEVAEHRGTRPASLVKTLPVPRRTIRTCLQNMVDEGFLVRAADGSYHPTETTAEMKVWVADTRLRQVRRLARALEALEEAAGRAKLSLDLPPRLLERRHTP